jgi:hypothetical protein
MAFKEVRRRSNLFRPWDSSLSTTVVDNHSVNKSQSSSQTLTKTTPESNVKRNSLKSNNSKSFGHLSSMRASTLNDGNANSISFPSVPTIPAQWQPNLLTGPNSIPMMPRHDLMLVHPHSTLPFSDQMLYEHINHQTLINASPFADPSLMNPPNISRHWRQIHQQKKQRPKRFQCPHCRVSFSNNGQLKGHIRIHTGIDVILFFIYNLSASQFFKSELKMT